MSRSTKQELRAYLQEKLGDISTEDEGVATDRAVRELQTILEGHPEVASVLLYRPLKVWREIDLTSLPSLLPRIYFDVIPCEKDAPFPEKKYDAVIIPLLGFNNDGYRLGHGGGWYDRFLATQSDAFKIGVGYENTLVDFTSEAHDIRMDVIVTEKQLRRFHSS